MDKYPTPVVSKMLWLYFIIIVVLFGAMIFFGIKGCDEKSQTKESETRELKAGTPDTVTIRTVDTLWLEKRTRDVVYVPVEKIVRYGQDSSRFDTTIVSNHALISVGATTFPAIDSLRLDVVSSLRYPEITKTDTIKITRVDTLTTTRIIETASEVPWYDRFWVGAVTSTAVVGGLIYALGGMK